eukprot:966798-Alexandrium_andersonii.AAC.1
MAAGEGPPLLGPAGCAPLSGPLLPQPEAVRPAGPPLAPLSPGAAEAEAARPAGAGWLPAELPPAPAATAPCCPPSVGPGGGWTCLLYTSPSPRD